MLEAATGLDAASVLREPERVIDPAPYRAMVARRAAREPLAFIVGWQEFWSLRFAVSPATLIPRGDSETLIEAVLALGRDPRSVLDLGTGTGCLLLAALSEYPAAWGVGVDRDPAAAALAARNAATLGMADRCAISACDWAAALSGRFDLVLSNPPYIESSEIDGLMPEVAAYEPGRALDGGADGLVAYRAILSALPGLLSPGGAAVLELGQGQAGDVAGLSASAGLRVLTVRRDLGGIERAIVLAFR